MNTHEKIALLDGLANDIENIIRVLTNSDAKKSPMNYELEALLADIVSLRISLQPNPEPEKLSIGDAIRLIESSTNHVDEACKIAVAAMKKQKPVKLRYGGAAWRCPVCTMAAHAGDYYCGNCGQRFEMPYMEG